MEVKLSKRLETIAHFVPKGARLVDVGSDHAYLPLFLVEKQRIDFAIAGEVVEGPYQSAVQNVAHYGYGNKIHVRLANGMEAIEAEDEISLVTIAGMGGRLIREILEAGKEKLLGVERLVLQPNNREEEVRDWLETNQFRLVAETILEENGKFYEVLVAEPGQMLLSADQRLFGPFLLEQKPSSFGRKWRRELDKLMDALEHIPTEYVNERQLLLQRMQQIKEAIHVSK